MAAEWRSWMPRRFASTTGGTAWYSAAACRASSSASGCPGCRNRILLRVPYTASPSSPHSRISRRLPCTHSAATARMVSGGWPPDRLAAAAGGGAAGGDSLPPRRPNGCMPATWVGGAQVAAAAGTGQQTSQHSSFAGRQQLALMATAATYSGMSGWEARNRSNRRAIWCSPGTSWANQVMYQLQ